MSIARAFTTRRVKQSIDTAEFQRTPQRSSSTKGSVGSIRHKISSPIQLVHTTNMLSYNAPDIHPMSASSTGSLPRSDDDMSDSALTNGSTPPTSPDIESTPKRSISPSPAPNHLSTFFTPPGQTPPPTTQSTAPQTVPQRALSHSKKPHNTLVRQRSASGMSAQSHRTVSTKASLTFSRSSSSSTSTSVTTHSSTTTPQLHHRSKLSSASTTPSSPAPAAPTAASTQSPPQRPLRKDSYSKSHQQHQHYYSESQHPFGPELAQVSELAEEYGVKDQMATTASSPSNNNNNVSIDAEEQVMLEKGLCKFSAEEYLSEVKGLFGSFFAVHQPVQSPVQSQKMMAIPARSQSRTRDVPARGQSQTRGGGQYEVSRQQPPAVAEGIEAAAWI